MNDPKLTLQPAPPAAEPAPNTAIYEALARAQAEAGGVVGMSGRNDYDKYAYAKLEDFTRLAHGVLQRHGLSFVVGVTAVETLPERKTKNGGTEYAVRVQLQGTLFHVSGKGIQFSGAGEGQDRADKAIYKAITGGKKYMLAGLLNLATTDDPESDTTVGTATAPAEKGAKQRSVPPKDAPAAGSERANALVLQWTGFKPEDLDALIQAKIAICKHLAIVVPKGKQPTEAEYAVICQFVQMMIDKKVDFFCWKPGNK